MLSSSCDSQDAGEVRLAEVTKLSRAETAWRLIITEKVPEQNRQSPKRNRTEQNYTYGDLMCYVHNFSSPDVMKEDSISCSMYNMWVRNLTHVGFSQRPVCVSFLYDSPLFSRPDQEWRHLTQFVQCVGQESHPSGDLSVYHEESVQSLLLRKLHRQWVGPILDD